MRPLEKKVAVVAGATRGAGRGIARALGEAGAIVYCTGRSTGGNPSPYGRSETIDETAELVNAAGGNAIPVRVDHTVESEVRALFERVEREHGGLDVLVNSIAGEDPTLRAWTSFLATDLTDAMRSLQQGLLSHVITAKYGVPLMGKKRRGLIVEVTEHDLLFTGGNALKQLVKFGLKGIAVMLAEELHSKKVAAVAITPGFLRSEAMLDHFGVTEANWRDAGKKEPHFLYSESPLFIGRAVVALAQDKNVLARSGRMESSWGLAREYGFTDADGSRPDWGKHFEESVVPAFPGMRTSLERHAAWLEGLAARAKGYLGSA
ncbi:MAG TPA: SDR family NAD(P)-dependent oxidoreductase [Gemmatimonadaceae bacterium]|nr:SDR family NAD(P)-dependent oxidoreductase [Gemmatimonadaceae bacterium]